MVGLLLLYGTLHPIVGIILEVLKPFVLYLLQQLYHFVGLQVGVLRGERHDKTLLLVVPLLAPCPFDAQWPRHQGKLNVRRITLQTAILTQWLVGEGKIYLTILRQLIHFQSRGLQYQRLHLTIFMEGVILRFGTVMRQQIRLVINAQKLAELRIVHLLTSTFAEGREVDIDTRCALLLSHLANLCYVVGIALIHRQEIIHILLIHLDTDFTGTQSCAFVRYHGDTREQVGKGVLSLGTRLRFNLPEITHA